jgi:hypothetical protein
VAVPSQNRLSLPQSPLNPQNLNDGAVLHEIPGSSEQVAVKYRRAGDDYVLIEYGQLVLDLNLRFHVHALMDWLAANPLPGILDLTPVFVLTNPLRPPPASRAVARDTDCC